MSKITKFEKEISKYGEKTRKLSSQLESAQTELYEKERQIDDLYLQHTLEETPALERELTRVRKEAEKLREQVTDTQTRLSLIQQAKSKHLESYRDDAKAEYDVEAAKIKAEYAAKLHDIKQIRAVLIEQLLDLGNIIAKGRTLAGNFEDLSRRVDDKYDDMRAPVTQPTARGLQDNYAGDHAPILPMLSEMQWAIDGVAPNWFAYWKATGEILSPAEIAAKEARK